MSKRSNLTLSISASTFCVATLAFFIAPAGFAVAQTPAGKTASSEERSLPDLLVDKVLVEPEIVLPGQAISFTANVVNLGEADSRNVVVNVCNEQQVCGECKIEEVPVKSGPVQCHITIKSEPSQVEHNPHFWIATVDPDGKINERNESNNSVEAATASFVVEGKEPPKPKPIYDEDELAVFRDGKIHSVERLTYGPDGAPGGDDGKPGRSDPAPDDDHGDLDYGGDKPERPAEAVRTYIHPKVLREAKAAGPEGTIEVIVQFARSDGSFPRLPDLDPSEPRLSESNAKILSERMGIMEGVRERRTRALSPIMKEVEEAGGRVIEVFVLGYSFHAELPVKFLDRLARDQRVRSIEPAIGDELPPNHDEVDDARDLIDSDAYFNSGATGAGWYLGLLDSGVRSTHTLFVSPDHIDLFRDCVNGNTYCLDAGDPDYDPSDDCWNHGTSTAAVITGNSNLGAAYRGVTAVTLDSFKVYPDDCGSLSNTAVLRGFDRALAWGDKVIVAEMQSGQSHTGSLAGAADDAFDAGSLVIAANGNNGPGAGTVNSPANAHKAIGIGAYDVASLADYGDQSRGPTGDARIKPDVRFPNNSETASATNNTATQKFGGTSGATPYGGAASILLVDWAQSIGWNTSDPGRFYSMLIAFGDREYPNLSNIRGAGDTVLGTNDSWWRGIRNLTHKDWDYRSFNVGSSDDCVHAAIWWPEGVIWHNDIDLYLYDPSGVQRHHSIMVDSVFESVELHTNLTPGTWKIGIHGYSVRALASPQTVYYFVRVCD